MADDPSWDEIFRSQPATSPDPSAANDESPRRRAREREDAPKRARDRRERDRTSRRGTWDDDRPPPRRKRRLTWLVALIVVIVLFGGAATAGWALYGPGISRALGWESNDYVGDGTGKVVVTIENGQIGSDVAKTLQKDGVTKTVAAFYNLLLKQNPQVNFQPGSYALKKQMSAKAALAAITNPANKVLTRVVLPEGITVKQVIARLSKLSDSTGVTQAQLEAAAADFRSYGLPADAPSLEGYLFPATYSFQPGTTAHQMLQTMVTEMFAHLDKAGVAVADRNRILTLASITQKEGGSTADFYKVARVWDNRIAIGMHLESDATVSYGVGGTTIATTPAERADASNPYNTYANAGLPIGPISNPGDAAIAATMNPAPGPWLYFVLVNGDTGETVFSTTLAQHDAAVKQWQAWLKANPGFGG